MKKTLMLVLLVLGLACAAGGYYIFYFKPMQDAEEALLQAEGKTPAVSAPASTLMSTAPAEESKPVTDYYVNSERLGVRESPDHGAFVESIVYRGDKLHVLEKKNGWGRISPYYVYKEGGPEVAEWVPMEALLEVPPTITKQERLETVSSYIEGSDDFKRHFEMFIKTTDKLLKDGTCVPPDFEELKGWVRSRTYSKQAVYFVYCGGLKQANKIYLNVENGEIFYR